jgi:NADPH-dependent glutamate synthase beta subunit-like oxidoreductase
VSGPPLSSAYRRLRIPDAERYWVEQVKCRVGCPVFTDACGYVTAVAEGRDRDAYAIARATTPFVSICGRICGAPCERACRRGSADPRLDSGGQALGVRVPRQRDGE